MAVSHDPKNKMEEEEPQNATSIDNRVPGNGNKKLTPKNKLQKVQKAGKRVQTLTQQRVTQGRGTQEKRRNDSAS